MPDWAVAAIVGILTSFSTAVIKDWFVRRKVIAEAEHESAQADKITGEAYQDVIESLRAHNTSLQAEVEALRSRRVTDAEVNRLLHEQKVHAITALTLAQGRLAEYGGGYPSA